MDSRGLIAVFLKETRHERKAHPKDHRRKAPKWEDQPEVLHGCKLHPQITIMSLEQMLQYQHPAVVKRFSREHPKYAHRADEIFTDLMHFFWLSKRHELDRQNDPSNPALDFTFIMDDEMRPIDQMWHVFLLYTQDYMDFCERYFGEYLHHLPDIVPTLENTAFDPAENLERFLGYVYDQAGEETLARWFPTSISA